MGGSKGKMEQVATLTPEQQGALKALFGSVDPATLQQISERLGGFNIENQGLYQQGTNALSNMLNPFDAAKEQQFFRSQVADPARQQFQEQVLPSIQEAFISQGAGRSSAAAKGLSSAATDLETGLARGEANYVQGQQQMDTQTKLNALAQAMGYATAPLQTSIAQQSAYMSPYTQGLGVRAFENVYRPGQASPYAGILSAAGGALGGGLGFGSLGAIGGQGFGAGINSFLGKQ